MIETDMIETLQAKRHEPTLDENSKRTIERLIDQRVCDPIPVHFQHIQNGFGNVGNVNKNENVLVGKLGKWWRRFRNGYIKF